MGFGSGATVGETDSGQPSYPGSAHMYRESPMKSYAGSLVSKRNRQAPSSDVDTLPHQQRDFVDASGATQVQIFNGLRWGVASGRRIGYPGVGFLYAVVPQIPGQTRGDAAGFHKKGPSPLNVQYLYNQGPGSQPANPGGPGQVASLNIVNPMTG